MEQRVLVTFSLCLIVIAVFSSAGADSPPRIARIVPDVSLSTTARAITIEGSNFEADSLIYVGSHLLRNVKVRTDGSLKARLPRDIDQGTYDVRVVSPGHRQGTSSQLTIVRSETAPIVTSVSPAHVDSTGQQRIVVAGHNFRPTATVSLGAHSTLVVRSRTERTITAELPRTIVSGTYDIRVDNCDGEWGSLRNGLVVTETDKP